MSVQVRCRMCDAVVDIPATDSQMQAWRTTAKEFDWTPLDDTVRCACGERHTDAPGVIRQCGICGEPGCPECQQACPECGRKVCSDHIIEGFQLTPKHKADVCTSCARLHPVRIWRSLNSMATDRGAR